MIYLVSLWLGILTSLDSCVIATTIAAIGYINRQAVYPISALINGILYTLGRIFLYLSLGYIILYFYIDFIPMLSEYIPIFSAPLLFVIGYILLTKKACHCQKKVCSHHFFEKMGYLGSFVIGMLFASSFCPISLGFYLSVLSYESFWGFFLYGLGTGLPVLIFGFMIAFFSQKLSLFYHIAPLIEEYGRLVTGFIFMGLSFYYTIIYFIP